MNKAEKALKEFAFLLQLDAESMLDNDAGDRRYWIGRLQALKEIQLYEVKE